MMKRQAGDHKQETEGTPLSHIAWVHVFVVRGHNEINTDLNSLVVQAKRCTRIQDTKFDQGTGLDKVMPGLLIRFPHHPVSSAVSRHITNRVAGASVDSGRDDMSVPFQMQFIPHPTKIVC
jgi:hypothetical protein